MLQSLLTYFNYFKILVSGTVHSFTCAYLKTAVTWSQISFPLILKILCASVYSGTEGKASLIQERLLESIFSWIFFAEENSLQNWRHDSTNTCAAAKSNVFKIRCANVCVGVPTIYFSVYLYVYIYIYKIVLTFFMSIYCYNIFKYNILSIAIVFLS